MVSEDDVILLDTNVLLDVLTERRPYYEPSEEVWSLCENGEAKGLVSAISFNNTFYLVRKWGGIAKAYTVLQTLRDVFAVVALDDQVLKQAISGGFSDFEDAIQYYSAVLGKADFVVTRNVKDYSKGSIPAMSPEEYLARRRLKDQGEGQT
ncbi:MAG TPA: PIN domain-containing protein [Phycisphaerae bacterium]|nr:PIN domain-containing protein [Phycisphaerae bacterium]